MRQSIVGQEIQNCTFKEEVLLNKRRLCNKLYFCHLYLKWFYEHWVFVKMWFSIWFHANKTRKETSITWVWVRDESVIVNIILQTHTHSICNHCIQNRVNSRRRNLAKGNVDLLKITVPRFSLGRQGSSSWGRLPEVGSTRLSLRVKSIIHCIQPYHKKW